MTPSEFLSTHWQNMRQDLPYTDLPFYRWLMKCEHPPQKLVAALQLHYAGHDLRGCFKEGEIENYRHIFSMFWSWRNERKTELSTYDKCN